MATYLRLALAQRPHFSAILAITFTHKATQEMKGRLLAALQALAQGKATELAPRLGRELALAPLPLQQRSQALLQEIRDHYDSFRVTTLDGFFAQLVAPFGGSLGFPPAYQLTLDPMENFDAALETLFSNLARQPQLQSWLTDLALHQLARGRSWEVRTTLKALATDLPIAFRGTPKAFEPALASLCARSSAQMAHLQALATDLLTTISAAGFDSQDLAWGKQGIWGFLTKIKTGEQPLASPRIIAASQSPLHWAKKQSNQPKRLTQLATTALQPQLKKLLAHQKAHLPLATSLAICSPRTSLKTFSST